MEIVLPSLTQQLASSASVALGERRQQQDAQRQASTANDRAQDQQQQANRNRAENAQRPQPNAESSRVINGEVLSSETQRVNSRDAGSSLYSRTSNQRQASGEADNRRISVNRAVTNFQENEDLVSSNNSPRQVSGIIDLYV